MRTLKDHTLIYDKDCPMCRIYTGAFVKGGWLDADGRRPFSEVSEGEFERLDIVRASNEIALVNRLTGEITYGLESLAGIVTHRLPFLRPVLKNKPIRWALQHFYSFISYNRKVIAAVKPAGKPCEPSFNLRYRLAYLLFAFLLAAAVYTKCLVVAGLPRVAGQTILPLLGMLSAMQGVLIWFYKKEKLMDYLGNMMTVLLMGALALLPALIVQKWLQINSLGRLYFLLIALGMTLEHGRRMKLLRPGWLPTISWLIFWVVAALSLVAYSFFS